MRDLLTDDTWSPDDDVLLRDALLSLREDVTAVPLAEPARVRGRGQALRHRRTIGAVAGVAAAVAIVAALGLRGVADGDAAPPPLPATPTPTVMPSEPPSVPTPTPTPTPTRAATSTPTPTHTGSPSASVPVTVQTAPVATEPPSVAPPPPATPSADPTATCEVPATVADISGVTPAAGRAATSLVSWAVACDDDALVARFVDDSTGVTFDGLSLSGGDSLPRGLSLPDHANRYRLLTTLLSLTPGDLDAEGFSQWPRPPRSDADWQQLVDLGLISPGRAAQGKAEGTARHPFVVIADTGQVVAFSDGT